MAQFKSFYILLDLSSLSVSLFACFFSEKTEYLLLILFYSTYCSSSVDLTLPLALRVNCLKGRPSLSLRILFLEVTIVDFLLMGRSLATIFFCFSSLIYSYCKLFSIMSVFIFSYRIFFISSVFI